MTYFFDTSALNIPFLIHKLKSKHPDILANSIVVSSISLRHIFPFNFKKLSNKFIIWNYINKDNFNLPLNDDIKVLMTAIDYEKTNSPDNMVYVTHNITLAHLANHYFGDDSILVI